MFEAASFYEQTGSAAVAAKFVAEFKRAAQCLTRISDYRHAQTARHESLFTELVSVHRHLPADAGRNHDISGQAQS